MRNFEHRWGKVTCDIRATEAARKFSAKLGVRLNKSTMRGTMLLSKTGSEKEARII